MSYFESSVKIIEGILHRNIMLCLCYDLRIDVHTHLDWR